MCLCSCVRVFVCSSVCVCVCVSELKAKISKIDCPLKIFQILELFFAFIFKKIVYFFVGKGGGGKN